MACRYYDDLIIAKLQKWVPEQSGLRVLKPDETKKLFEIHADDTQDRPFKLPLIAISRNNDIELLSTVKQPKSFDGLRLYSNEDFAAKNIAGLKGKIGQKAISNIPEGTYEFNVIPIKLQYQIDIFTKDYEEADEYVRQFLFKLINNPVIKIAIPYNNIWIEHIANIRVLNTVSDTSAISERIFSGEFTRFTIQLELQDAFLFSIPYKKNWRLYTDDNSYEIVGEGVLEISPDINSNGELEDLDVAFKRG